MNPTDNRHMQHALSIGARGLGQVWPNPAVGCVLVQGDHVVGRGWTQPGGAPHGEVMALAQAGSRAAGATAYVTLEPCSHHGKTPPCADALIDAGIKRVVVATTDPNPQVDGQGLARLKAAGVEVTTGVLEAQARRQHAGFISRITTGRPMLTLKMAASFDGRIATASGESQWITGSPARRLVRAQRARHDAVMVGGGTARADDPGLGVQDIGIAHQPVRVVWSSLLDLPLQGRLAQSAKEIPLWIIHAEAADSHLCDAWSGLGATLLPVPVGPDRRIEPTAALNALGAAGLTRIYCEGGGQLAATLLAADLVDELVTFTAGFGLGGDGVPMLADIGLKRLADAQRFNLTSTQRIGADTVSQWSAMR